MSVMKCQTSRPGWKSPEIRCRSSSARNAALRSRSPWPSPTVSLQGPQPGPLTSRSPPPRLSKETRYLAGLSVAMGRPAATAFGEATPADRGRLSRFPLTLLKHTHSSRWSRISRNRSTLIRFLPASSADSRLGPHAWPHARPDSDRAHRRRAPSP